MGARLTVCGQTLFASSAEAQQIVAADGARKWVVVDGVACGGGEHAAGATFAATEQHVAWHDDAAIVLAPVGGGELVRISEHGTPWVQCLAADATTVYVARGDGESGSVLARVAAGSLEVIARCAGGVDAFAVSGEWLAFGSRAGRDVFAVRTSGGAPSLVYSASAELALCAAEPGFVLVAVGRNLVRLELATGAVTRVGPSLAAGTPLAIAWQPGVAWIARDVAPLGRQVTGPIDLDHPRDSGPLGRCIERVDLATGATAIVHALAPADPARIDYLVATERGAFFIETRVEAKLVHVARDAAPVARSTARSARPSAQGRGTVIEVRGDTLRASFDGEVTSCAQLVDRMVAAAPRRLELACEAASPGALFSTAIRGATLPSEALIAASGAIGELHVVLAALPALARAFVAGTLATEPLVHATLTELHLGSDRLEPSLQTALAASQLPRLERCALAFKRISTAALLALAKGLVRINAPQLREVHFGELRGGDQIRDVLGLLAERGAPPSWQIVSFGGKLGGEDAFADIIDGIHTPPAVRVAVPLDGFAPDFTAKLLHRRKWLCAASELGWQPGDVRTTASW